MRTLHQIATICFITTLIASAAALVSGHIISSVCFWLASLIFFFARVLSK